MRPQSNANQIVEMAYIAHAPMLVRRLTAFTHDPGVAEDLVQDAFVRLLVEVEADRVPDNIAAWLHRVGHNLALSRGRRLAVADRHQVRMEGPGSSPSPESIAVQMEDERILRQALAELGTSDRDALILSAGGYRGREIATLIGRTDMATRTMLCRARAKLRGRLTQAGAGTI